MAFTSELEGLHIQFENFTISKGDSFLNVNGNRVVFSNQQHTMWVFEKQQDSEIYAIRNANAGKDEPKYIGSANANNIVFLYVSNMFYVI